MVRRLPVLQDPESEDAHAERRPAWQWIGIGTVLTLLLFLPLSGLASWAGVRLALRVSGSEGIAALALAAPPFLAFQLAAILAGTLVGRFGKRTTPAGAALAGGLGGASLLLLAGLGSALSPWVIAAAAALLLIPSGAASAWLGARFGRSLRR